MKGKAKKTVKKIDPWAVGVIAFLILGLFFVAAAFVGPQAKLKNSQAVKDYAAELESLIVETKAENRRIEDRLAATDCQEMAESSTYLHWETANLQTQVFAHLGIVLAQEGLLGEEAVDLPDFVEQNLAEIRRLMQERLELIRQRLAECLDRTAG